MSIPVIVGGGLAGLSVALALAPRPVVILGRKINAGLTSSELAQGGIAAAVSIDDTIRLHEQDTLAAGAGLCDPAIVKMITASGPQAIERLMIWGASFDRDKNGELDVGLEGAHSRRRVVHADGSATGAAVMRALIERVKTTNSITFIEDCEVCSIQTDDRGITGVVFRQNGDEQKQRIVTDNVILATGSSCALWRYATVPQVSWGHGLLLAARAGARLRDLEFMQFHPTALDNGLDPMQLLSEALRGEGARLINDKGQQFIGELNPRDVVARANWQQIEEGHKVFLDMRQVKGLRTHFKGIFEACLQSGLDPSEMPVPIRPVAHYHMGGIATDDRGRTNVAGLWACGECAGTGLHGANRLASNSLLEAVVMGCRIADALRASVPTEGVAEITPYEMTCQNLVDTPQTVARVRSLMMNYVGLRRQEKGLLQAIEGLEELALESPRAQVGLMVAKAALARQESRGAHDRVDYPEVNAEMAYPLFMTLAGQNIVFSK